MIVSDFNTIINHSQFAFKISLKRLAYELATHYLLANHGFFPTTSFQHLRASIPWQLPHTQFFLPRPIPLHGFCSTDLQRKSQRHRYLSACRQAKTISCRHSRQYIKEHAGRCQRKTSLADICRLRTTTHTQGTTTEDVIGVVEG